MVLVGMGMVGMGGKGIWKEGEGEGWEGCMRWWIGRRGIGRGGVRGREGGGGG